MENHAYQSIGMRYTLCATCRSWSKEVRDTAALKSLSIPHMLHLLEISTKSSSGSLQCTSKAVLVDGKARRAEVLPLQSAL
jgi:aerobic-type carbon monoxide dehydrogenase small subunit (CoxS/CutS family)